MSEELYAVADFCLIPMGTGEPSVAKHIAECQTVLRKTGLTYKTKLGYSGYGTNIAIIVNTMDVLLLDPEGPWSEVSKAIHDCHQAVHALGAPRVATDIRIGTRIDREVAPGTGNAHKVTRVEQLLEAAKED